MTLLRVRVVDPLGVRQWQAELVPIDSAAMVRRAGSRLRRDAVADQIPQVLPLEEELASALLDQLRPDRRRPRAREGPETRASTKRVDDVHRAREVPGGEVGLRHNELGFVARG